MDNWGNRSNEAPSKCSGFSTYTPADTAGHNRISGTCYDVAGNYLGWSGCPSLPYSPEYNYDAENRLVTTQGVTYTYDGDGNRVKKSNGTLYWGESTGSALAESDLSGNMQHEYISFNGKRIARLDIPSGASPTASNAHYYFSDHLGSSNVVTDYLGTMAPCPAGNSPANYTAPYTTVATGEEESDFLPYGRELALCDKASQHYKFTGKERDSESGLDEFGARYYTSAMGRFMTPDWAEKPTSVPYANFGNPQSLNLYSYVENNPTTIGDPDGHGWIDPQALARGIRNVVGKIAGNNYASGGTKVVVGMGLVATTATGDVPGGAVGAVMVVSATIGGITTVVSGTADILGKATHTDVSEGQEALKATQNVPALVTTVATGGNMKAGETVGTLANAASLAAAPKEAVKNAATAADAAETVRDTSALVKSSASNLSGVASGAASNTPPLPPAPKTPPPPSCAFSHTGC